MLLHSRRVDCIANYTCASVLGFSTHRKISCFCVLMLLLYRYLKTAVITCLKRNADFVLYIPKQWDDIKDIK